MIILPALRHLSAGCTAGWRIRSSSLFSFLPIIITPHYCPNAGHLILLPRFCGSLNIHSVQMTYLNSIKLYCLHLVLWWRGDALSCTLPWDGTARIIALSMVVLISWLLISPVIALDYTWEHPKEQNAVLVKKLSFTNHFPCRDMKCEQILSSFLPSKYITLCTIPFNALTYH